MGKHAVYSIVYITNYSCIWKKVYLAFLGRYTFFLSEDRAGLEQYQNMSRQNFTGKNADWLCNGVSCVPQCSSAVNQSGESPCSLSRTLMIVWCINIWLRWNSKEMDECRRDYHFKSNQLAYISIPLWNCPVSASEHHDFPPKHKEKVKGKKRWRSEETVQNSRSVELRVHYW